MDTPSAARPWATLPRNRVDASPTWRAPAATSSTRPGNESPAAAKWPPLRRSNASQLLGHPTRRRDRAAPWCVESLVMRSGDEHDKRAERQRHATAAKEWAAAARKRANEAKERLLE